MMTQGGDRRGVDRWRGWIRPSSRLTDHAQRWRARLLAAVMLVGSVLATIMLTLRVLLASHDGPPWYPMLLPPLAAVGSYALARTAHWRAGAWLIVVAIVATVSLDVYLGQSAYVVVFVGLAITLGGMVLRNRETLVSVALALLWTWSMPSWSGRPFDAVEMMLISAFFITLGLVLAASISMRERIETLRLDALAKGESRYRGLLEVAFEGLVVLKDERIVDLNPGFLELCGRNRSELVGRELSVVLTLEDPDEQEELDLDISGQSRARPPRPGIRTASGTRPDGEAFHVELVTSEQQSERGLICYVAVRDVTEQRRAALQLSVAHRAVALGTLSAGIAHEINNPLSWMMTNLQSALDDVQSNRLRHLGSAQESLEQALADALQGGRRMMGIVRDLKTLSKDGSRETGVTDVHGALDLACRVAGRQIEARARLVRDYGHVPAVVGSSGQLGQIFLNLLINASQAIPEGERERHRILLRTRQRHDAVEVVVRDDGRGIPSGVLPHIFDPFFTTKSSEEDGTGLGLSITRSIVDRLGGTIEVDSREGQGATFTVRLPVADRAALPSRSSTAGQTRIDPATPEPLVRSQVRVLVIDDEPLLGKSLSRALSEHEVVFTEDPTQALELCAQMDFDVIVCDLMMPVVSGEGVYLQLRQSAPELAERMIFMTGGAFTHGAQRFLEQIDNPVLTKPFSPQDLRVAVRRMLDAHAA